MNLVQIRSNRKPAGFREQLLGGPVVDKFFLAAYLSGVMGIGYAGIHLWLALHGGANPAVPYNILKTLHTYLQLHLFLGFFFIGFLMQAAPKLLEVTGSVSRWCLIIIPLFFLGIFLHILWPHTIVASLPFAAGYGLCFLLFANLATAAGRDRFSGVAIPILFGLGAFFTSVFASVENPDVSVVLFWAGPAAITFGAAQQFIQGFLGGRKLVSGQARRVWVIFSITFLLGFLSCVNDHSQPWLWSAFGAGSLITMLLYLTYTQAWKCLRFASSTSLGLSFLVAHIWALLGALLLFRDPSYADLTLHAWSTGWASTLILAVSPRILSFLSGGSLYREKTLLVVIALWQLVPVGRTIYDTTGPIMAYIVSTAASLVLIIWGYWIVKACVRIFKQQAQLNSGDSLPQC